MEEIIIKNKSKISIKARIETESVDSDSGKELLKVILKVRIISDKYALDTLEKYFKRPKILFDKVFEKNVLKELTFIVTKVVGLAGDPFIDYEAVNSEFEYLSTYFSDISQDIKKVFDIYYKIKEINFNFFDD